jgi:putative hemolysin
MVLQLTVLVILILLNALFTATERAFVSINDTRIEVMAKDGDKKAKQIKCDDGAVSEPA